MELQEICPQMGQTHPLRNTIDVNEQATTRNPERKKITRCLILQAELIKAFIN